MIDFSLFHCTSLLSHVILPYRLSADKVVRYLSISSTQYITPFIDTNYRGDWHRALLLCEARRFILRCRYHCKLSAIAFSFLER